MAYNTSTDTNNSATGWGVGLSAIIGGALGYWAGRSSNPFNNGNGYPFMGYPMGYAMGAATGSAIGAQDNSHCRTCYQQGMETGEQMSALRSTAQQAITNGVEIRSYAQNLSAQLNSTLSAINNRFDQINQQKIADQAAEIAALRTQNMVGLSAATTNAQLSSLNDKIAAITAGCAVRAVPGCPNSCGCSGAA